jgi:hypothetical protein
VVNAANTGGYLIGGVLLGVLAVRPTIALIGLAGLAVSAALAVPTLRAIARERAAAHTAAAQPTPQVALAGVS